MTSRYRFSKTIKSRIQNSSLPSKPQPKENVSFFAFSLCHSKLASTIPYALSNAQCCDHRTLIQVCGQLHYCFQMLNCRPQSWLMTTSLDVFVYKFALENNILVTSGLCLRVSACLYISVVCPPQFSTRKAPIRQLVFYVDPSISERA